jgi:hypothetical protein
MTIEKLKNILNDIRMLNNSHGKTARRVKLFPDAGIIVEIPHGAQDDNKAVLQPPHKAGYE